jgi:hypothetical protein
MALLKEKTTSKTGGCGGGDSGDSGNVRDACAVGAVKVADSEKCNGEAEIIEPLFFFFFFFSVPVCAIAASGVPGGTFVSMNSFSTLCG